MARDFRSIRPAVCALETLVFVESGVNAAITLPPANYQTSRRLLYRDNNRPSKPVYLKLYVLFNLPDRRASLYLHASLLSSF